MRYEDLVVVILSGMQNNNCLIKTRMFHICVNCLPVKIIECLARALCHLKEIDRFPQSSFIIVNQWWRKHL